MKNLFVVVCLCFALTVGAVHLSAGPPSYQVRSTFTQRSRTAQKTTPYGIRSYSTRASSGTKINSVPYGNGWINRSYDRNGFLMDTSKTVPYGTGWLTR